MYLSRILLMLILILIERERKRRVQFLEELKILHSQTTTTYSNVLIKCWTFGNNVIFKNIYLFIKYLGLKIFLHCKIDIQDILLAEDIFFPLKERH